MKQSVIEFIKKLRTVDSHYARKKSGKQYLPPDLTRAKLYRFWIEECEKNNIKTCSYGTFSYIMKSNFNLGFGNPRVDVCSTCTEYESRLAVKKDPVLKTEYKLHRHRAKRFYQELGKRKSDPSVLCIIFDMQQNQPLPKCNISEAYYKRQLWVYNLTFVIHKKKQGRKNIFIYSWLESERGKGSNEVCSALNDLLHRLRFRIRRYQYTKLHLYADSCAGQNKNLSMLASIVDDLLELIEVYIQRHNVFLACQRSQLHAS